MTTETMTIHEALSELKVIGARIDKEISYATFVDTNKHSNTKIGGKPIAEYGEDIKSNYQKITDLIRRRTAIKKAVVKSNAVTEVTINGETMTVAEAIEYKNVGIDFLTDLLKKIIQNYQMATARITSNNGDSLEDKANDYVVKLYGGKDKDVDNSVIEAAKKSYIENNTLDIIDPINASKVIKELTDEIDAFNSKVDAVLSVSNATTTIEVSY